MAVDLPALPRGAKISPRYIRLGGDLRSALGGATQRVNRLGSRFAIDVELPPLDAECAAAWVAAALRADGDGTTLRLTLPQLGPEGPSRTGSGSVNAAQASVSGEVQPGQLFSFAANGRQYLHIVTAYAAGTMSFAPRLRAPMSGALEFVAPKIEGFAGDVAWSVARLRFGHFAFAIEENE